MKKLFSTLGATLLATSLAVAGVAAPAAAFDNQTYLNAYGSYFYSGQPSAGLVTLRLVDTAQSSGQYYWIKLDGADLAQQGTGDGACQTQSTDGFFAGSNASSELWTGWTSTYCNVVSDTSPAIIKFQGEASSPTTSGFFKLNSSQFVAASGAQSVVVSISSDGTNWTELTDGVNPASIGIKKQLKYDANSCISFTPNASTAQLLSDNTPVTLQGGTAVAGKDFLGWASTSNASTQEYLAGDSIVLSTGRTLYAVCTAQQQQQAPSQPSQPQPSAPQQNSNFCSVGQGNYVFQTRGNGGATSGGASNCGYLVFTTSGTLPANNYVRAGYTFTGWNTQLDGSGVSYAPGTVITVTRNIMNSTGTMQNFYAQWSATGGNSSPSVQRPSATLGLSIGRGARVHQAPAPIVASGLQPNARYTVEVHSTPIVIASGNVASDGSVNYTASIPAGLEAGWHSMIFTSTALDGTTFTSTYYFKVAGDGTLLSTSETIPAELAYTGTNTQQIWLFLAGGFSLALIGAELLWIARRKRSN